MTSWICFVCGFSHGRHESTCFGCHHPGTSLVRFDDCPECGSSYKAVDRYCGSCGATFDDEDRDVEDRDEEWDDEADVETSIDDEFDDEWNEED